MLGQLARFLTVGAVNTALSFCVYQVLLLLELPYLIAAVVGFASGAWNGYVLNRRWTFLARDTMSARGAYVFVQVAGALATAGLVFLFHDASIPKNLAYLAAVPPVTLGMFVANLSWTFAGA